MEESSRSLIEDDIWFKIACLDPVLRLLAYIVPISNNVPHVFYIVKLWAMLVFSV